MKHPELKLFGGAYLLYNIGRWITAGEIGPATDNAHWIVRAEETLGIAVERSVQDGLQGGVSMWLLSHLYLAAQFVVLPAALIYLFRRAPKIYRPLRDTVLFTWLISIPVYAAFPRTRPPNDHLERYRNQTDPVARRCRHQSAARRAKQHRPASGRRCCVVRKRGTAGQGARALPMQRAGQVGLAARVQLVQSGNQRRRRIALAMSHEVMSEARSDIPRRGVDRVGRHGDDQRVHRRPQH